MMENGLAEQKLSTFIEASGSRYNKNWKIINIQLLMLLLNSSQMIIDYYDYSLLFIEFLRTLGLGMLYWFSSM